MDKTTCIQKKKDENLILPPHIIFPSYSPTRHTHIAAIMSDQLAHTPSAKHSGYLPGTIGKKVPPLLRHYVMISFQILSEQEEHETATIMLKFRLCAD